MHASPAARNVFLISTTLAFWSIQLHLFCDNKKKKGKSSPFLPCSCRTCTVACTHFAPGISHVAHIFRSFTLGTCCSHSTFLCIIQTKSLLDTSTQCFTPSTAHIIQFTRSWTLVVVHCFTFHTKHCTIIQFTKRLTFGYSTFHTIHCALHWWFCAYKYTVALHFSHHTLCTPLVGSFTHTTHCAHYS